MNNFTILAFGILSIFQVMWLLCYEVNGRTSCPVQPFNYSFIKNYDVINELKEDFIKDIKKLDINPEDFNTLALTGLVVTISEVVLVFYYFIRVVITNAPKVFGSLILIYLTILSILVLISIFSEENLMNFKFSLVLEFLIKIQKFLEKNHQS